MRVETLYDLFAYKLHGTRRREADLAEVADALASKAGIDSLDDQPDSEFREASRGLFEDVSDGADERIERLDGALDAIDHVATTADERRSSMVAELLDETEQFNNVVLDDALRNPYYVDAAVEAQQLVVRSYGRALAVADHLDVDAEAMEAVEANRDDAEELLVAAEDLAGSSELESLFDELADETPQN